MPPATAFRQLITVEWSAKAHTGVASDMDFIFDIMLCVVSFYECDFEQI
jgi:hypothetical protein